VTVSGRNNFSFANDVFISGKAGRKKNLPIKI